MSLRLGTRTFGARPASDEDSGWAPRSAWARKLKWAFLALAVLLAIYLPFFASSFWVGLATQALIFGLFALSINLLSG